MVGARYCADDVTVYLTLMINNVVNNAVIIGAHSVCSPVSDGFLEPLASGGISSSGPFSLLYLSQQITIYQRRSVNHNIYIIGDAENAEWKMQE